MGAKKARRKLARTVIADIVRDYLEAPHDPFWTRDMSDDEFDRLVQEIRNARVTVTWPDEKGRK